MDNLSIELVVLIFENLDIINIYEKCLEYPVDQRIWMIKREDVINFNKKKVNLMLVCKLWKEIIENFFMDKIYFPNNVDISIVKKYNTRKIIGSFDGTTTDKDLESIPNIVSLNLIRNTIITDLGLMNVSKLTSLYLRINTNITDKGLSYLPNLTSLDLWINTNITDKGLENLSNLTYLNLGHNQNITDKGLSYLPNITHIDLGSNKNITDDGLEFIPNIKKLYIGSTKNIRCAEDKDYIFLCFNLSD